MRSPFKFLDSYTRKDRELFFGRDKEIAALYRMVYRNPLTLVYGLSGTGKSSLIQCGLASRFDGPDWYPLFVRRGKDLNASFKTQIMRSVPDGKEAKDLREAIHLINKKYLRPVYLIFDQFEELFILGTREEQETFVKTIAELLEAKLSCHILLIMREEYLGNMYEFERYIPYIFENRMRVERMNNTKVHEVITSSFLAFNMQLAAPEKENMQQILDNISMKKSGVQLPFLQVYLDMLYREDFYSTHKRERSGSELPALEITSDEIDALGRIDDVLNRYIEEQYTDIPRRLGHRIKTKEVQDILDVFVSDEGTKIPIPYKQDGSVIILAEAYRESLSSLDSTLLSEVLAEAEKSRVLRFTEEYIELSHDSLAKAIDERRTDKQKQINEVRQALRMSHKDYLRTGQLLSTKQLSYYYNWLHQFNLSDEENSFVEASHNEVAQQLKEKKEQEERDEKRIQEKKQRKIRNVLFSIVGIVCLMAAGISLYSLSGARKAKAVAEAQRKNAVANDLAHKAENLLNAGDRTKAFQLAGIANHYIDPTNHQVGKVMHNAYYYNDHPERQNDTSQQLSWYKNLNGHSAGVYTTSFSPDGKSVITGSWDKTAKIWDVETGKEIKILEGHSDVVTIASFSPDGKSVVTGSWDQTAKIWDVETGEEIKTLEGHLAAVYSASFSPDGLSVITGSWDQTAKIWDAETGKEINRLVGHTHVVEAASFSPDGERAITGSGDQTAKIWDIETGGEIKTLEGHTAAVYDANFSPDGKMIITGSSDSTAKIWDVETGNEIKTLEGHTDVVEAASFSPDGKSVITGSGDRTAKLWDVETGSEIKKLETHTDVVYAASFSIDGKSVITGSGDKTAKIWTIETGNEIKTLEDHSDVVTTASFSPDGKSVITGSGDQTAKIWDVKTGNEIKTLQGHTDGVYAASFSPNGKNIITCNGDTMANIKIWDFATGKEIKTLQGHTDVVTTASFSPDGKSVITGSVDQTAKILDVKTGKEIKTFEGHTDVVFTANFSPNGKMIITGSNDKMVKTWDVKTGKEIKTFEGHTEGVTTASFSPDSKMIITGSNDKTVKIWDVKTGKEIKTLQGHAEGLSAASFSPDGKRVITGSGDKTAKIWDVETGKEIKTLQGHTEGLSAASFSLDGKSVITGGGDQTAKIWNVAPSNLSVAETSLAFFSFDDIRKYHLQELLEQEKKWAKFLVNEHGLQLFTFENNLQNQGSNNNNQDLSDNPKYRVQTKFETNLQNNNQDVFESMERAKIIVKSQDQGSNNNNHDLSKAKLPTKIVRKKNQIDDYQMSLTLTLISESLEAKRLAYISSQMQDVSGIFHQIKDSLQTRLPALAEGSKYKYPSVREARSSRQIAYWYHKNKNLLIVQDAMASRNSIRPGAVLFYGKSGQVYSNINIDMLTDRKNNYTSNGAIQHIAIVTAVTTDEKGNVIEYTIMHGRNRRVHASRSGSKEVQSVRTKGLPPFGNWNQQLVAIAYIATPK